MKTTRESEREGAKDLITKKGDKAERGIIYKKWLDNMLLDFYIYFYSLYFDMF